MRVVVVNVYFAPYSYGGATLVAEQTALGLRERGHEVFLVSASMFPEIGERTMFRYEALGMPTVAILANGGNYLNPRAAKDFASVLEIVKPDVVLFHSVQHLGVGVVEAAQDAGIATVAFLHDAWWLCERQFMVRQTGEWCGQEAIDERVCTGCVSNAAVHRARQDRSKGILNRCDRVLAPSRSWCELMAASGVVPHKIHTCPNGVLMPKPGFRRQPRSGGVRLGFIGGRSPIKGYRQVRDALQTLDRDDYELIAVDAESLIGGTGITPADWPLRGRVKIVPGYSTETMDDFFGGLDVLLFPSQARESFGLTVREAMVRGVWPIVTAGGGQAESIRNGVNGTIIPLDGDHRPLATAIAEVLDHAERFGSVPIDTSDILSTGQQSAELEQHLLAAISDHLERSAVRGPEASFEFPPYY